MRMRGFSTGTDGAMWFCHVCNWSGWLRAGAYHACKKAES